VIHGLLVATQLTLKVVLALSQLAYLLPQLVKCIAAVEVHIFFVHFKFNIQIYSQRNLMQGKRIKPNDDSDSDELSDESKLKADAQAKFLAKQQILQQ